MDVPIDVVEWELFVPEQFKVDRFDGNLIDASLLRGVVVTDAATGRNEVGRTAGLTGGVAGIYGRPVAVAPGPGQIAGVVVDPSGAVIPGASVTIVTGNYRQVVTTNANGAYIASNVPSGQVSVTAELTGFKPSSHTVQFDQTGRRIDAVMRIAGVSETVTLSAEAPLVEMQMAEKQQKKDENQAPSQNVQDLQRRVSGVLPVPIDVPHAGSSHQFLKPLVVDEEAQVTFRYRRR
jgi:hypothetical protein